MEAAAIGQSVKRTPPCAQGGAAVLSAPAEDWARSQGGGTQSEDGSQTGSGEEDETEEEVESDDDDAVFDGYYNGMIRELRCSLDDVNEALQVTGNLHELTAQHGRCALSAPQQRGEERGRGVQGPL